eukprot:scaffold6652_cov62-Phaeocystis_antarctica.AAC.3
MKWCAPRASSVSMRVTGSRPWGVCSRSPSLIKEGSISAPLTKAWWSGEMAIEAEGVVKRRYEPTMSSSSWRKPRMGSKPVSVLMRVPTEARSMAIDWPSSRVRYEPAG